MPEQLHDIGDQVGDLEVTGVSYNENEKGEKINFQYTLEEPAQVRAREKQARKADREAKRLAQEAKQEEN